MSRNNVSDMIVFRLLRIPFDKQKIENFRHNAQLEKCNFTSTCQVKSSHIHVLRSRYNKTRPSNNRRFMEVYFSFSYSFSLNVSCLLNYCTGFITSYYRTLILQCCRLLSLQQPHIFYWCLVLWLL